MMTPKDSRLSAFLLPSFPETAISAFASPGFRKSAPLVLLVLSLLLNGRGVAQSREDEIESSFRAGQAALKQGEFRRAAEDFKKVLALDPSLVEAEVNLGLAYQSMLDYEAAAHSLSHALSERPNLPGVNVIAGMDFLKLGAPEKAAPYIKHALQLDPGSIDGH